MGVEDKPNIISFVPEDESDSERPLANQKSIEDMERLKNVTRKLYDRLQVLQGELDTTPSDFFGLALAAGELPTAEMAEAAINMARQLGHYEGLREAYLELHTQTDI
jgi:hypothetical protein